MLGKELTDDERVQAVLRSPFFMNSLQDCGDDEESENIIEALQTLQADGSAQEVADNFKTQGNNAFHKKDYQNAISYYTRAIDAQCDDSVLNSALKSNRAAVNLKLGNNRKVLRDCAAAIGDNPKNLKASVKALYALERFEEAIDCCMIALELDCANEELLSALKNLKVKLRQTEDLQQRRIDMRLELQKSSDELKYALETSGYQFLDMDIVIKHPLASSAKITHTENGLTFPVLLLYPEYSQSDFITEFNENESFYNIFQEMFHEPASWDNAVEYNALSLELFFESTDKQTKLIPVLKTLHASKAASQNAAQKYVHLTLADVLRSPLFFVQGGVCTFLVTVRDSAFNRELKGRYAKMLS